MSDEQDLNFKCPVCGVIYESPVTTLRHEMNEVGGDHGDRGSLPGKHTWPQPTEEEADGITAEDAVEEHFVKQFEGGEEVFADLKKNYDGELPPVLTEHDAKALNIIELAPELTEDLEGSIEKMRRIDQTMDLLLSNIGNIVEEGEISVDTPDEEEEEEPQVEGRFTTADVKDREIQEVMNFIERTEVLVQEFGEPANEVFRYVYENRDSDEGVTVKETADRIGLPESDTEEILDGLYDMGAIERDDRTDEFYYVYGEP